MLVVVVAIVGKAERVDVIPLGPDQHAVYLSLAPGILLLCGPAISRRLNRKNA